MLTRTFLRPLPFQYDSPFVLCLWPRWVHCRQERVNLCQFIAHIIMVKSDVSYTYCFPRQAVFRSIIVLCCSNIVFLHPKSKYIWLLIRSLMLWRLDPWLIDYGGGGVLTPFLYVNDNILGVPIKVQIRLRTCVHPDYAARCTSIKKFWQLSWMILMWARLLSKLFHRPRVRSSFIH